MTCTHNTFWYTVYKFTSSPEFIFYKSGDTVTDEIKWQEISSQDAAYQQVAPKCVLDLGGQIEIFWCHG